MIGTINLAHKDAALVITGALAVEVLADSDAGGWGSAEIAVERSLSGEAWHPFDEAITLTANSAAKFDLPAPLDGERVRLRVTTADGDADPAARVFIAPGAAPDFSL